MKLTFFNIEAVFIMCKKTSILGDKCQNVKLWEVWQNFNILFVIISNCQFCDRSVRSLTFVWQFSGKYFRKMATWRNLDVDEWMWMKDTNASGLSQDQLKIEAMKFSEIFSNVDKKTISKVCDIFWERRETGFERCFTCYIWGDGW